MTVDVGVDITESQDRGVLKRIIKEGTGTETPTTGCVVVVHYIGTLLDGTKFDASRDRNEPFEFTLGRRSVIKAWDVGVATMKKGEVCVLTCAPEYAYGANGSPPKIPPNATLQFEIEMVDWSLEDLSPGKNKGILRYIIEPGEGTESPNDGALVTVEIEGKLDGKIFDTRTVTFQIGEGSENNVCEGIEKALEKFHKGEKSRLTLQPRYAFKAAGNSEFNIPPDATVDYTVKLISFEKAKEPWAMDTSEKVEQAQIIKEKGTTYFKQGKYLLAIKMYKRAINFVEDLIDRSADSEEQAKLGQEIYLSANLNLALVYLKVTPPHHYVAIEHADKALKIDPDNVKGLFRRGQALMGLEDPEEAIKDFQKVVAAEPNNKAAANQITICRQMIKKQNQKAKALYANMFEKFAKHDTELEQERAKKEVDVIGEKVGEWGAGEGEWTDSERDRKPTEFEKENPNILMLDKDGQFQNM